MCNFTQKTLSKYTKLKIILQFCHSAKQLKSTGDSCLSPFGRAALRSHATVLFLRYCIFLNGNFIENFLKYSRILLANFMFLYYEPLLSFTLCIPHKFHFSRILIYYCNLNCAYIRWQLIINYLTKTENVFFAHTHVSIKEETCQEAELSVFLQLLTCLPTCFLNCFQF